MSTIILRLEPPFVFDTPKGKADIHFMADYGYEADTLWGGFLRDSRQFWWFSNKEVLIEQNITIGRIKEKAVHISESEYKLIKEPLVFEIDHSPQKFWRKSNVQSKVKSRKSKSRKSNARMGSR